MDNAPEAASGQGPHGVMKRTERVAIWDPAVRIGHWALVAAFAIAYLSAEEEDGSGPDILHVWAGYAIGIIVALRLIWGFVGPRTARFSDFVYKPTTVVQYLVDLGRGRARRYLGHSPAGGAMVVVLLAFLAATVVTGLAAYGDLGKGPLADAGGAIVSPAFAEDQRPNSVEAERESTIGELHETLANITLALIVLHILGVVFVSLQHRENLVAAMISGRKRAED
jgi:cytochrome b